MKKLIIFIALFVVFASVVWAFILTNRLNKRQAVARVYLSYLRALEAAYHADKGEYAYFAEYYGAPIKGQLRCHQPSGAKELGFHLKECERDPQAPNLYYAFRVMPGSSATSMNESSLVAEARSGSDITGQSFICGNQTIDEWRITEKRQLTHTKSCDSE